MPQMHFVVRWPDGDQTRCYSPSLVVREHLQVGRAYPVAEFVARSRTMLEIGSERVRAKYGYACSAALDQLAALEERAATYDASSTPEPSFDLPDPAPAAATVTVTVTAFELPAGAGELAAPVSRG